MKNSARTWRAVTLSLPLFCLGAGTLAAQAPAPAAVLNPASNIPGGLPNSGIAPGSIIVVYGTNLGQQSLVQATSLPLPTTAGLGGTSVTVTVKGSTVAAPMIYTLSSQLAAVLPSTVPVGTGTLTVTYNGVSGSTPITVVASNFGISTVNQTGTGAAVVTFPDYSLVTGTKSAKPGDVLILWGTGLGATSGSDAVAPVQVDLGTSIQLLAGGVATNVLYRGRSGSPGLDQINFVVPQGVSGCSVSLAAITSGSIASNYTTFAVSPTGGACSDGGGSAADLQGFLSSLSGKNSVRFGFLGLEFEDNKDDIANNDVLTAQAAFLGLSQTQFAGVASTLLRLGAGTGATPGCSVSYSEANLTPNGVTSYLDAGSSVSLRYPSGSTVTLPRQITQTTATETEALYGATLPSEPAGTYTFSNGAGGADVGPFSVNFTLAQAVTWTNPANAAVINRNQPLTITWTGGDSNAFAAVALGVSGPGYRVNVDCSAPASAGQLTIPTTVLLALPAGKADLSVLTGTPGQLLPVPGFDMFIVFSGRPAQSILPVIQ